MKLERQNAFLTNINISEVDLIQLYKDSKEVETRNQIIGNLNKWDNFRSKRKEIILRYADLIKVARRFKMILTNLFMVQIIRCLAHNYRGAANIRDLTVKGRFNCVVISVHWQRRLRKFGTIPGNIDFL